MEIFAIAQCCKTWFMSETKSSSVLCRENRGAEIDHASFPSNCESCRKRHPHAQRCLWAVFRATLNMIAVRVWGLQNMSPCIPKQTLENITPHAQAVSLGGLPSHTKHDRRSGMGPPERESLHSKTLENVTHMPKQCLWAVSRATPI